MIPALLLWLLSWDASVDPYVTSYRVSYQAHYRSEWACPIPEDPDQMCATTWEGMWTTEIIPDSMCGWRCASDVVLPYIHTREFIWFQLVAARDSGCESQTAWPPA